MDKPSNSFKVGLLIFVILLVLAGGGFGAWKILGTKEEEKSPPITGRKDPLLTKNQLDIGGAIVLIVLIFVLGNYFGKTSKTKK
jgi:hypothetical protein